MRNIRSMKLFEQEGDETSDDVYRLYEILEEVEFLMTEANDIVRSTARKVNDDIIYERWKAYPYNNIMAMLSHGSKYDTGFIDIIKELEDAMKENDEM